MSDKTISAGDVVRVVWGCCADLRREIGFVGTVVDLSLEGHCAACGYEYGGMVASLVASEGVRVNYPVPWLIKIDPPAKAETVNQGEELHA